MTNSQRKLSDELLSSSVPPSGARVLSRESLSAGARQALRDAAVAAHARAAEMIELAELWQELVDGRAIVADQFFTAEGCFIVLEARASGLPERDRSRFDVLTAVLSGLRQKIVAIDRALAASTVATTARLALKTLGVTSKPSHAHPLLMLAAHAASERSDEVAKTAVVGARAECQLRVVGVSRPERRLSGLLPAAELAVLYRMIEGASYAEIARERGTSTRTIANQVAAVYRRLHVSGRNELVQRLYLKECQRAERESAHDTSAHDTLKISKKPAAEGGGWQVTRHSA
jgi:DNA-binding NarL/FixJ family response regulator